MLGINSFLSGFELNDDLLSISTPLLQLEVV